MVVVIGLDCICREECSRGQQWQRDDLQSVKLRFRNAKGHDMDLILQVQGIRAV